jgi:ribosomal protein S3AE
MAEKKKFINVQVPILNKDLQVLGTPKELHKRTIKLDLSRKLRGKGLMITLQMYNQENKLVALPKRLELIKSYITRVIRKRTDNVEDSFNAQCLDVVASIKPFLITRKRVSRVVRKNLRNTAREFLFSYVRYKEYNQICEDILNGTLQREMLPKLKKIYPLAFCDIRIFETKDLDKLDISKIISKDEKNQNNEEEQEESEEEVELEDKEEESEENLEEINEEDEEK